MFVVSKMILGALTCGVLSLMVGGVAWAEAAGAGAPLAKETFASISAQAESGQKEAVVKVSPPPRTKLNFDGPWKLTVKGMPFAGGEPVVLGKKDFDQKENQFRIPLKEAANTKWESGKYDLVYFICDDPTTWCKRAKASGEIQVVKK